jgi:hypothetical protein
MASRHLMTSCQLPFALLSYCFPPDQMNDRRLEAGDDQIVSSQLKAT